MSTNIAYATGQQVVLQDYFNLVEQLQRRSSGVMNAVKMLTPWKMQTVSRNDVASKFDDVEGGSPAVQKYAQARG